jgi:diguanylate cyclase (GGDEF)-like protein
VTAGGERRAPIEVLLIEDSPGDVRLMQEAFRDSRAPIRLHVASDGVEAMAFLRREGSFSDVPRPGFILLDLNLPRMDGREVLAHIKGDEGLKAIPTVVLTTSQAEEDIVRSYQLQANAYLTKPVTLEAFETLVKTIQDFWLTKASLPVKSATRLLLVEDNLGDAELLRGMLNDSRLHTTDVTHVTSMLEAEKHLAQLSTDIILLDLSLPDAHSLGALRWARTVAPRIPLVVVTALDDEFQATEALQEGAQDYLIKGQFDARGLQRALRYAIERMAIGEALLAEQQRSSHASEHDSLTGLPNRAVVSDRIAQAIALAPRHGKQVAVLVLDLDGFKHINDSLGHPTGDRLLQSVATRLVECVRGTDTVSRQGGDEFLVLLSEADEWSDAALVARRMLETVAEAHSVDGRDLHITTSIGVSVYPEDGDDAETLIKNADTAMYQAKENGRQSYQFFKPEMNVRAVERQSIEQGLRRALERDEFALHYQPKVNLRTGAIVGAEALIRWTSPDLGSIPPAQFIPVAEDSGLIVPIGKWVLRRACEQTRAWLDAGLPMKSIAVNVSAVELRDENFVDGLFAILEDTSLDPGCLELELTESVVMNAESVASILHIVSARGVRVAIDDFGTGYASLSYLRKFPVHALKIDQSFVSHIGSIGDDTSIVTAVISMARSLNLRVIAEGVETPDQLAFLLAHECDEAQGFYFSRPMPAEAFATVVRGGQPLPAVLLDEPPGTAPVAPVSQGRATEPRVAGRRQKRLVRPAAVVGAAAPFAPWGPREA